MILLCSDGLSNMLGDDEILQIIKALSDEIDVAAKALIDSANEHGGKDNIAIVLMKV